jgi:hypothetical protein
MKMSVRPRQRRLLALCAASAAVHLALLELVARHGGGTPSAMSAPGADLHLRLAPPSLPVAPAPPAPRRTEPAAQPPAPPPRLMPARVIEALPAPAQPAPAASLPPVPASEAGAPGATPDADAAPVVQMPGRYRTRLPDSVRLTYTSQLQRPGAPAQAGTAAHIDWRNDGQGYRLDVDGVSGKLHSEGDGGDAGIVPRRAVEQRGDKTMVTEFDLDGGRVLFRAGGAEAPSALGIQDPASLLLQLTSIGLGEPDQMMDRIDIVVADSAMATIARFQVMEEEQVETALGPIAARRLAQVVAPGRPRLEVWLAPARDWLPVQVRVSQADGSVATQTVSAIDRVPATAP